MGLLQTLFGPAQVTAFHVDDAQIVVALDVHRVQIQNADVALEATTKKVNKRIRNEEMCWSYLFRSVQIFQAVDVDITEENKAFDVVRVIMNQLLQERNSLERSTSVRQQQGQVEQGRAETWFQQHRSLAG